MNKEFIQSTLQGFFDNEKEVLFAYLFGSHATGHAIAKSDVDIAVYLNPKNKQDQFEKRLELIAALTKLLKKEVDVIVLNMASPFLKHVVFKEGTLVFDRDASSRIDFDLKSLNEYFDYKLQWSALGMA
ncbi:MAG TPA: nucleotidyltransferase domain-containing protein [Candidatus Paceibacterota bacterium]|nr:nucleotidyltransferase domain-containing protein [Candidatus Paceibacterota bacterium]